MSKISRNGFSGYIRVPPPCHDAHTAEDLAKCLTQPSGEEQARAWLHENYAAREMFRRDMVENALAAYADHREQLVREQCAGEWIAVSDRLPEAGERVLVEHEAGFVEAAHATMVYHEPGSEIMLYSEGDGKRIRYPYRWHRLPTPPDRSK